MSSLTMYDNGFYSANLTKLPLNVSLYGFNSTGAEPDLTGAGSELPAFKYIMLTCFILTFIFGATGNGLVIYIIAYFPKVREKSVANYYIWNLAFADEMFLVALPLFCYNTYSHEWPFSSTWFGDVSCKLSLFLLYINKFSSVLTLVALSVDRYLASWHRLAYLRTIQVGKLVCLCVWLLCCLVCIPQLIFSQVTFTSGGAISCSIKWPGPGDYYHEVWLYSSFTLGLVLPFLVIVTSYVMLLKRFRNLVRLQKKSGRRMTQTVIAVVVTFLLCQTPYYVFYIVSAHKRRHFKLTGSQPSEVEMHVHSYLNGVAQTLVFVSSCVNPIIYALFNENFRKLYRLVLCQCRTGTSPNEDFKDLELDGKYVPMNLKVEVTFHVPCPFYRKPRSRGKRAHTRTSVDIDTGMTEGNPQVTTTL